MRFELPLKIGEEKVQAVNIPQEDLDKAPECLLSVAAQNCQGKVVTLAEWPHPDLNLLQVSSRLLEASLADFTSMWQLSLQRRLQQFATTSYTHSALFVILQAVACCLSGTTTADVLPIAYKSRKQKLRRALEYFNIPDDLWPLGINLADELINKREKLAVQIWTLVKIELKKRAAHLGLFQSRVTAQFMLHRQNGEMHLIEDTKTNRCLHDTLGIPEELQDRLMQLAAAEHVCLDIPRCWTISVEIP